MLVQPRNFSALRGTLTGVSDRQLDAHIEVYTAAVGRLNAMDAANPLARSPGAPGQPNDWLVAAQLSKLDLEPTRGLLDLFAEVGRELAAKAVKVAPVYYLGTEAGFSCNSRAISVPWFLATPATWALANRQPLLAHTPDMALRSLRHEVAHAVCNTHALDQMVTWVAAFGDPNLPYSDTYAVDPRSRDHAPYLAGVTIGYPQKHPHEDWAETFGRWLDSHAVDWRIEFKDVPGVAAKFQWIEDNRHLLSQERPCAVGLITRYQKLPGTVGERLGIGRAISAYSGFGWDEHAELRKATPAALNAVVLHELYFSQLRGKAPIGDGLARLLELAWGNVDTYLHDLRACCRASSGWVLTVYEPLLGQLTNCIVTGDDIGVPANAQIVLAVDCYEHAYALDYGTRKDLYLAAMFENLDWGIVEMRLTGLSTNPVVDVTQNNVGSAEMQLNFGPEVTDQKMREISNNLAVLTREAKKSGLVAIVKEVPYKAKAGTYQQVYWVSAKSAEEWSKKTGAKIISDEEAEAIKSTSKSTQEDLKHNSHEGTPETYQTQIVGYIKMLHAQGKVPLPDSNYWRTIGTAATAKLKAELIDTPYKAQAESKAKAEAPKAKAEAPPAPKAEPYMKEATDFLIKSEKLSVHLGLDWAELKFAAKHDMNNMSHEQIAAGYVNAVKEGIISSHVPKFFKEHVPDDKKHALIMGVLLKYSSSNKMPPALVDKNIPKGAPASPKNVAESVSLAGKICPAPTHKVALAFGAGVDQAYELGEQVGNFQTSQVHTNAIKLRYNACHLVAKMHGVPVTELLDKELVGIHRSDSYSAYRPPEAVYTAMKDVPPTAEQYKAVKALARASQSAMEAKNAFDADGYITLYRGWSTSATNLAIGAQKSGSMPSNIVTSFSRSASVAKSIGGPIVTQAKIHRSQVLASFHAVDPLVNEEEVIVMTTGKYAVTQIMSHGVNDWNKPEDMTPKKLRNPSKDWTKKDIDKHGAVKPSGQ